jgi:recombination protein RecT
MITKPTTKEIIRSAVDLPSVEKANPVGIQALLKRPDIQLRLSDMLKENASYFAQSLITIVNTNPHLRKCEPNSIMACAFQAAMYKLPLAPQLGYIYFVPFKKGDIYVATLIVGYKGYFQLALRSNTVKFLNMGEVYEGEIPVFNRLSGNLVGIEGKPTNDKITDYFIYYESIGGFVKSIIKSKEELMAHGKKYSPAYSNSYGLWKTDPDVMFRKTLARKLASYMVFSLEDTQIMASIMKNDEKIPVLNGNNDVEFEMIDETTVEPIEEVIDFGLNKSTETELVVVK